MAKQKTIYCPNCGRKVATWDGKSTINIIVNCRKCNKRVVYRVDTGETEIKKYRLDKLLAVKRFIRRWYCGSSSRRKRI